GLHDPAFLRGDLRGHAPGRGELAIEKDAAAQADDTEKVGQRIHGRSPVSAADRAGLPAARAFPRPGRRPTLLSRIAGPAAGERRERIINHVKVEVSRK